ncbi:hypothetical protein [Hydrogenimonas sp.]
MDDKRREKYLQTRYKRELERFLNRLVNFSRQEGGDKAAFDAYVYAIAKKLAEAERVPLYNDYYDRLERFVEMARRLRENGELGADEAKGQVLHEANQIRKSRRIKSYNRKERSDRFEEEF